MDRLSDAKREFLRAKLAALNKTNGPRTYLGQVRNLLAPEDTLAYPPLALSAKVYSSPGLADSSEAVGMYNQFRNDIRLEPNETLQQYIPGNHEKTQYSTLLHEAGHARGEAIINQRVAEYNKLNLLQKLRYLLSDKSQISSNIFERLRSEDYANALMDSLVNARKKK